MRFRSTLLAVAALAALAAADAAPQNYRPIRQRDAAAARAGDVYQLVEALRPEWLWMGGDPRLAASRARVRVFVDGNQVGGLEALRGLSVDRLSSIRTAGRELVMARDSRMDPAVVGALLVRYEDPPRAPGRLELSAGIGRRGELQPRARQALLDAGMDMQNRIWDQEAGSPYALYATGKARLRGTLGGSLNVLHTGGHNVRGIPPEPPFVGHSSRFTTTDVAAQVFAERSLFRLGAGPAARVLRYRQTTGGCECDNQRTGYTAVAGAAADLAITAPALGPMRLELVYAARWFPSHAIPAYERAPEIDLGGVTTYLTLGAAWGF